MNVNVTETTTGVQISENPAGLASGVLTGSFPSPELNYAAIDNESMARTTYRLFSDFPNNSTPWNIFTGNGASSSFSYEYSGSTVNYVTITLSTGVPQPRGWVSDRPNAGVQPRLVCGMQEMVFAARVRMNRNSQTNFTLRSGFSQGHAEPVLDPAFVGDGQVNAACFYCAGSKTTWHTLCAANYNPTADIPTGNAVELDTGIPVGDWNVLKIWSNAAGTEVRFYIDGILVNTVTTASAIPTVLTADAQANGNWMMPCTSTRGTTDGLSQPASFDLDWQFFEYKIAR
jgi:hypothetical protein